MLTPFSTYFPPPPAKREHIVCPDAIRAYSRCVEFKSLVHLRSLSTTHRRFVNALLIEKINQKEITVTDLHIWKYEDLKQYFRRSCSKIQQLDFQGFRVITDFTFLKPYKDLVALNISWHSTMTKVNLKRCYPHLREITLIACSQLKGLRFLKYCPDITHLDISGCSSIPDLKPLRYCTKLISVKLIGCQEIKDFTPLSLLKMLEELDISGCRQIQNFNFVKGCLKLKALFIEVFMIKDDLRGLAEQMQFKINPAEVKKDNREEDAPAVIKAQTDRSNKI